MTTFIYALHCLIVFGVPALFGWVVLRRIFREISWVALVPGSFVIGYVALMAAVNELRFGFEMGPAVWFAYKALLALALILIVSLPTRAARPRLPGCIDRGWKLVLLGLGAVTTGFYYGIPALSGYLNDAWWYHYPATVQIMNIEHFPLTHVFAVDGPLYYHYGPDLLSACWSFLLEQPVQTGCALNIILFAPCAFLLAFALLARLARNYWAALFGATFLIAGGNLRFLLFLTGNYTDSLGALQVFNSQTVQGLMHLMFTPSHALGVPLTLLTLLLFRHVFSRPSWRLSSAIGLVLGTMTLISEWYFVPLIAVASLLLLRAAWRRQPRIHQPRSVHLAIAILPAVIGIFWSTFNNTYLAGMFARFWMRDNPIEVISQARQTIAAFGIPSSLQLDPHFSDLPVAPPDKLYQPKWSPPNLLPVRFNTTRFGQVPSWESAASSEGSFISLFSPHFLMEAAPILLVGVPFGLWLAWRRRQPLVWMLAWIAVVCLIPPIFLDWGHRSTDFLRFFTAAFCYASLFVGWLVGSLLSSPSWRSRLLGGTLGACCLANPIGLGLVGLMPGTINRVKTIAGSAQSLSQARPPASAAFPESSPLDEAAHEQIFEKLAVRTGDFLYPITKGRERAIVIVPPEQVPEVKYFQNWMKMATLSRLQLPIGWHWQNSYYSSCYRDAVTGLDASAIVALDAKWVIVSNIFQPRVPAKVGKALTDQKRFSPVGTIWEGRYYMSIFRILP